MADALRRQSGEVIAMQRDAGPEETERLQSRLAGLGAESSDETGQRAELRRLLQNELELVWRMRDRLEITSRQRAHRFELLRSLYEILCESCVSGADSPPTDNQQARARAVCDELRRELEGAPFN